MGLFSGMDISASGLTAQRLRLDLIANNVANINTTRTGQTTAAGNPVPYRREVAVFTARPAGTDFDSVLNTALGQSQSASQVGQGVQVQAVVEDPSSFQLEYNPDSPDAAGPGDPDVPEGYVRKPNVNIVTEMTDMISASRAYEANVTALNAEKAMASKALEIGKG